MQIHSITAHNVARRTFTHKLHPLTIIGGANGAGKTTVLDTIILACLGKHPICADSAKAIMEHFASEACMTVAIETAKGKLARTWTRNGKTCKATHEGDEGIGKAIAPAIFNGDAFFNAKPADRANMLRAAFPSAEDPKANIIEAIQAKLAASISPPPNWKSLEFDSFVNEWENLIDEAKKSANAAVTRLKKTIQGLAQLEAEHIPEAGTSIEEAEKEHTKAVEAHAASQEALKTIDAAIKALPGINAPEGWSLSNEDKASIAAKVADLEAKLAAINGQIASAEQTHKMRSDAYAAAKREYDANVTMRQQAQAQLALAEQAAADYNFHPAAIDTACGTTLAPQVEEARTLLAKIEQEVNAIGYDLSLEQKQLNAAIRAATDTETCECCGASREHWSASRIQHLESKRQGHATIVRDMQQRLDDANARLAKARESWENLSADEDKRRVAYTLRAIRERIADMPQITEPTAPESLAAELERLNEEANDLECNIEAESSLLKEAETVEKHRELEKQREEKAAAVSINYDKRVAANVELDTAKAAARLQSKQRENAALQQQAAAELDIAEAELKAAKQTEEALKEASAKEAEKAVKPILDMAARFTAGILEPALTNTGLAFGRWHGAQWQPINRLSGAERTMVKAAISAALGLHSESKIVIIDELAVMRPEWKERFLDNLVKAYDEGLIEQAILIDHSPEEQPGWTIIQL